METPLEKFTAKIFSDHLHTRFKTQAAHVPPVELELSEIEERESSPRVELFFLRFRGPHAPQLPQQIYSLEHEKLGTFAIFLTAISADESGICYESVFNRLRSHNQT
jgi:hypothetical protein